MSRWVNIFENHIFQNTWSNVRGAVEEIEVDTDSLETHLQEIARCQKVVTYLDHLINSCDPELVPFTIWDTFHHHSENCYNQLYSFNQNQNLSHIQDANRQLDNLLTTLHPYVSNGKKAAQAAGRAFLEYSKIIRQEIENFSAIGGNTLKQTEVFKNEAEDIKKDILSIKDRLSTSEQELIGEDGDDISIRNKILSLFSKTQTQQQKIEEFHKKLTSGSEEKSSIILQIEHARENSTHTQDIIQELYQSSTARLTEIDKYYNMVFGEIDEDGIVQNSLKKEIEEQKQNLDSMKLKHSQIYNHLHKEIESLLPGATSAGLATAYNELKESFDNPIKQASILFYVALVGFSFVSLMLVSKKIGFFYIDFFPPADVTLTVLLNNFLFKFPLVIPFVWLAAFASKRRSENRRLQQEYAHKEALAKSYQGFKQQIENLSNDGDNLMNELLAEAIKAIAFNASTTLDGKHGDKIPLLETLEKLANQGINVDLSSLIKK